MSTTIQNKLLNYEVSPPAGAWQKIEDALDESELAHEFPSRLYGTEIIPPVTAWNKIANSLDAELEPAKPERRKIAPLLRYAAAAILIGLLTWGGILALNNKSGNKDLAKNEPLPAEKNNPAPIFDQHTNPEETTISIDNNIPTEEARNDAALEASKRTVAKLDMPAKSRIKEIASGYYFASSSGAGNLTGIISQDQMNECDISSRYITLMSPEGNIIRISKKLTDLACCVSGEEENNECRDQMKKWREKIICSPTCHSTGSFMDILGLVDALQEY
jgi:hypothetical protein